MHGYCFITIAENNSVPLPPPPSKLSGLNDFDEPCLLVPWIGESSSGLAGVSPAVAVRW